MIQARLLVLGAALLLVAVAVVLHGGVVRPSLRRHGQDAGLTLRPSRLVDQLRAFSRRAVSERRDAAVVGFFAILPWVMAVLTLVWLALAVR